MEPGPDTSALRDGSYGILFGEWKYYASYKNPKPEPASEEEIAQLEALPKSAQGNIYISGGKPVTFLEFSRINNIPYSSEPSAMTAAPPSKTGNPPAGTYQYDEDKRTWVIKVPGAMDQPVPSGSDLEGKLDNIRNEWGWREFTVSPDDGPIEPIVPKTDIPYAIEDGHYKFENGAWNRVMSNGALAPIENSGDLGKERYTILDKINARRAAEGNNPGEFIVTNGIDSDAPAKAGAQIPATDALPTGMNAGVYEFDSGSGAWMNLGRPVTNPAGAAYLETKREERKANGLVGERFYLIDDGTTRDAPAAPQSAVPKRDTNIIPPATQAILPSAIPPVQGLLGITGYAGASGSPATGILGTVFGGDKGLIGKLAGGGGGIVRAIFGTNPFVAGLAGGLIGGTVSYMTQKDEMQFSSMQPDTEIKDIKLVEGAANKEKEYANVNLTVEGFGKKSERAPTVPQPLVNNPDLISQGIESFRLIFENRDSFTTSEDRPEYAHLKVTGVRHKYKDKVYDRKDFIDDKGGFIGFFDKPTVNSSKSRLEEDPAQTMEQRFRLEFNSIPPSAEKVEDIGLLNCQDGTRVGKTGADALPKVKFRWNWNDIKGDTCNEDNLNGVYCDATQFSIALLKRVNALNEYLGQNGPDFTCPSSLTNQPARNEIGTFDTGIEALATVRNGNDIDVVATIRNTNPGEVPVKATIKLIKPGNSGEIACSKGMQSVSVAAGGKEDASCTFSSLPAGVYTARAEITPTISCTNCGDIAVTNSLSKQFSSGVSGLEQCEPFSTARLSEFLEASGEKNPGLVATAKFNALLMVDGYSSDFQHDFDLAQSEAFFNAPDFYTDSRAGLGNYFKDTSLFSFDAYSQPNFTLPGPGTYNIVIDITYKDRTWKLFDTRGNPTATITIRMEKLKAAEPDSPFYYVPFDGLLGEKDGRIGYGINFAGDPVQVDNSRAPRRTVDITGSATIPDGILTVSKGKNFKSMQVDERGVVAKLSRANGSPTLLFQPSNATPVILKIDKNTEEDAYAIYEPAIDGDAVDVGQQLTLWNGIGAACRGFNDEVMSQQQFVPDTHGISTRCALVGPNQRSKYALEFCGKVVNYGSAYYETVFYTPQDSDSYLKLVDVSSDSAQFISEGAAGNQVPLNGNGLTPKINSLEDIFSLVTAQSMCITGTSLNAEFFWNPKQIFTTIQDSEEDAISSCIAPVKRNK
ncbi:MAG TPA: hypothetical protein HA254_07145 [Candidatus Diapherotrites archaeon]|uniref:Uncharacterized protein n=1 Tax=Candidatus Iainarchaeum sp. TaxID=3101447 RepID=A0A7J4IXZ7_9ARCH|nr:hypothetical protein [Candidatus Diapherotrites archaeon]